VGLYNIGVETFRGTFKAIFSLFHVHYSLLAQNPNRKIYLDFVPAKYRAVFTPKSFLASSFSEGQNEEEIEISHNF